VAIALSGGADMSDAHPPTERPPMKLRLAFLASLALLPLLAAALPAPAVNKPDLIIVSVTSPNYDGGIVRVRVRNQGNAPAGASYLMVQLSGLQTGTTTIQIPGIAAGQMVTHNVQTGKLLSAVNYLVLADRANTVSESHERNNTMSGTFGGKP
jgi:subtilase family serine protease